VKSRATEGVHARKEYSVSVDGSLLSSVRSDCADGPVSEGPIEQVRFWSHERWLACLRGHEFAMPAQQQSFVIRAAVYASAKSRAMLRVSSHPAVRRMKECYTCDFGKCEEFRQVRAARPDESHAEARRRGGDDEEHVRRKHPDVFE
jgi:hypothetical protein